MKSTAAQTSWRVWKRQGQRTDAWPGRRSYRHVASLARRPAGWAGATAWTAGCLAYPPPKTDLIAGEFSKISTAGPNSTM